MTFGELEKATRLAKGMTAAKLAELIDYDPATISGIEHGDNPSYESAEAICKVLGIEYPLDGFKHQRKWLHKKGRGVGRINPIKAKEKPKRKDTTAEDEAEARLLGISYGTYIAYKETGYLETFKKQQKTDRDKGKNIIKSNLIGAGNAPKKYGANFGASKVS